MGRPAVAPEISVRRRSAIEDALRDGYAPFGMTGPKGGCVEPAAAAMKISRTTLNSWVIRQVALADANKPNHCPDWSLWNAAVGSSVTPAPIKTTTRRGLWTCAQDDTPVHPGFWPNLMAYAAYLGAEVVVGGVTYQKGLFEDHASRTAVFAEAVRPYLRHDRLDVGPVVFCAEMNTLPTAVRPLSSLEGYTAQKWGVFPHVKVQLGSVPTFIGAPFGSPVRDMMPP